MPIPMNPTDLGQMFSMNPGAFQQAQGLWQLGKQQQQTEQDSMLQKMLFEKQMQPLLMQQQQGVNDRQAAELPGVQADSWQKQRNQQVRQGIPLSDEQRMKLSEMAAKMSDDEWKQAENELQRNLISQDPQKRAAAQRMLPLLKEFQMESMKNKDRHDREMSLAKFRAAHEQALEDKRIAAGKYVKGGAVAKNINDLITSGKLTYEKAAVALSGAAYTAELEGDVEKAQQLRMLADQYAQKNDAARAAGGAFPKAGAVDVGQVTNLPTVPARPVEPFVSPVQPNQAKPTPTKKPTNAQEAQAAGWKIMTDKNGNKAWVSPDKTQFFEVK